MKKSKKPRCTNCKKIFYSSKGNEHCMACRRLLNEFSNDYTRRYVIRTKKASCDDVEKYKTDILLLSVKNKWGLMNSIDYFRVAHIYMAVICDAYKYSQNDIENQVTYMLNDLNLLLKDVPIKGKRKRIGKIIVQLNKSGKVIKEWPAIASCARDLDISTNVVTKICDGGKSRFGFNLKWKRNLNI